MCAGIAIFISKGHCTMKVDRCRWHGLTACLLALCVVLLLGVADSDTYAAQGHGHGAAHGYYIWDEHDTRDPRSCLAAMSNAIEASDAAAFDKRVDIQGIARTIFFELEKASNDDQLSRWLPPVVTFMASQGALTNSLTIGFLTGEVREFVLYGVGSGAFAGSMTREYESSSILAPLFSMVSMGRKEIREVGVPQRVDRGKMRLSFSVYDYDNGNTYAVQGIFSSVSDGWQLTGIENVRDLIIQIGVESQEGMV